jgi:hypothetical protein
VPRERVHQCWARPSQSGRCIDEIISFRERLARLGSKKPAQPNVEPLAVKPEPENAA